MFCVQGEWLTHPDNRFTVIDNPTEGAHRVRADDAGVFEVHNQKFPKPQRKGLGWPPTR